MGRRSLGRLLVIGAIAAGARDAAAQAALVIESYAGERPPDADRVLAPLRQRLERRGYATAPAALIARIGHRLPLPGTTDPALTAAALAARIDAGYRSALRGDYELAIGQLEAALAAARENPSRVVADPAAPAWQTKALAGLAFARGRLGDSAAAAALMAEQVRSFPDHPVTRDAYGPEAERLYTAARRELETAPRGALVVGVGRPDARVHINERARAEPGARHGALPPGAYRVLVEAGGVARRYTASVRAGGTTHLAIDWDVDARLTAGPRWLGIAAPPGGRDRGAELARRFARGGADDAFVIGIVRRGARRLVVAQRLRRGTGAVERAGAVELREAVRGEVGAGDRARLAALGDYLAGGARGREILPFPAGAPPRLTAGGRAVLWTAAGVAVAAAVAGGYLVQRDGGGTCAEMAPVQCPRVHDTAVLGWSLIGSGSAALGAAIYWYVARPRLRGRAPAVAVHPTSAGALASVGWRF